MPQTNPWHPEHKMQNMIARLFHGQTITEEEALYARSYREKGSDNWQGQGRLTWLWWVTLQDPDAKGFGHGAVPEAVDSLVGWFARQEREGHMRKEMLTSSHYELYLQIAAGARWLSAHSELMGVNHGARIADLSAAWWCRQEALMELCWVEALNAALFPCARSGHGGISQGAAVCHQLLRGLPLLPQAKNPKWWDSEDMLGPLILRALVEKGDTFGVGSGTAAVRSGTFATSVTIDQLPPDAPLLYSPIIVERSATAFRAYVEEWKGGDDPCLWAFWSQHAGRLLEWIGKGFDHVEGGPPALPDAVTERYRLGPGGWMQLALEGGSTKPPEPEPPLLPPPTSPPVTTGLLIYVDRMRNLAARRPAAAGELREIADDLERAIKGGAS